MHHGYKHILIPLDSSRVDDFIAQDYIQHNPMAETGAEGLKKFLNWAKSVSDRPEHRVKRILVDGDFVVAHVHVIPNHGENGNNVVDIFRIENGLVAEHWDAAQALTSESNNNNGIF